MGPQGATGPQGLPGPAGPGTRVVVTATIGSSGGVSVPLSASVGTNINLPPSMACYTGQPGGTVWLSVASTASSTYPFCGLVFGSGVFNATMSGATPGNIAAFVIVY
jgi:hypothetical protein